MRIAVDTSVLLAVLKKETGSEPLRELIVERQRIGDILLVCDVVWGETAMKYKAEWELLQDVSDLGVRFDPLSAASAFEASRMFLSYRKAGGPKKHILPDFYVGGHAKKQADALLTIDDGFARIHFVGLSLISPTPVTPSPPVNGSAEA